MKMWTSREIKKYRKEANATGCPQSAFVLLKNKTVSKTIICMKKMLWTPCNLQLTKMRWFLLKGEVGFDPLIPQESSEIVGGYLMTDWQLLDGMSKCDWRCALKYYIYVCLFWHWWTNHMYVHAWPGHKSIPWNSQYLVMTPSLVPQISNRLSSLITKYRSLIQQKPVKQC